MDQTTTPAFKKIAASSVYETDPGDDPGWSGYLMPAGDNLPVEINIDASLTDYPGHYLFCVQRPKLLDSDPKAFAEQVLKYINDASSNRVILWLENANPLQLGPFDCFGVEFGKDPYGGYQANSNLNVRIGDNVVFAVLQQTAIRIDDELAGLRLSAPAGSSPPLLGFMDVKDDDLGIDLIGSAGFIRARIPFTGTNTACFVFSAAMDTSITFDKEGIRLGFSYIVNNRSTGKVETILYDACPVSELPDNIELTGSVDPSDPANARLKAEYLQAGYIRSGFTVNGKPDLLSNYRSSEGKAVLLTPLGGSTDDIVPPLFAGGFAWASCARADATPGNGQVYLTPLGKHGMAVESVDAGSAQTLLGGLFGSERISFISYDPAQPPDANDLLFFLLAQPGYAPIFPFDTASLNDPDSGDVRPRLTDTYRSAWATLLAGAATAYYQAEPEGSALYGKAANGKYLGNDEVTVLASTPPKMQLAQGTEHVFPLLPYGAPANAGVDGNMLVQFESQIVVPTRKHLISKAAQSTWQARTAAMQKINDLEKTLLQTSKNIPPLTQAQADEHGLDLTIEYGTTPQGFIVQHDAGSSAYLNVSMAQSLDPLTNTKSDYLPFAFNKPTPQVQDALQSNQLFLVAVNNQYFDDPAGGASFQNTVNITDWTMSAQIGKNATATSYRNVMIMKFCEGSLQQRVSNPNRWTAAKNFSLLPDTPPGTESLSYTGLSQWLQDYIETGIARAEGQSAAFYKNFKNIVTDPDWNGVIVLAADLSAKDLPPEIAGLAAGIDFSHFTAHHFGFTTSRVEVDKDTGVISMSPGDSSLFGLIDYEDPLYASNLANGVSPTVPIPVPGDNDFDFTVLQLQSLFENAHLVKFQSYIQLTVNHLFAMDVTQLYNGGAPQPANGIVLKGSYIDQGGDPSYIFEQNSSSILHSASNLLPATAFNRVQFNTLGPRDGGATIASRFVIWGAFDFVQLDTDKDELLDVMSFGSKTDTPVQKLGEGLAFSNLLLEMTFAQATPNAKTFVLNSDNQAWDLNASSARDDSLFSGFGLQLKSFVSADANQTPDQLGYLPVTSGINLKQLEGPWFGVVYEITLGGPGALASAMGFTSNLLVAWSPTSKTGDASHSLFLGMSLPGAAPGAKLFSLQGVFKVAVGSISILRQQVPKAPGRKNTADDFFYCLRIDDIGIKIFGIVKLPPNANIQFFLFGDPNSTGSLGWYAAYVADDNPGVEQQRLEYTEVDTDALQQALTAPEANMQNAPADNSLLPEGSTQFTSTGKEQTEVTRPPTNNNTDTQARENAP